MAKRRMLTKVPREGKWDACTVPHGAPLNDPPACPLCFFFLGARLSSSINYSQLDDEQNDFRGAPEWIYSGSRGCFSSRSQRASLWLQRARAPGRTPHRPWRLPWSPALGWRGLPARPQRPVSRRTCCTRTASAETERSCSAADCLFVGGGSWTPESNLSGQRGGGGERLQVSPRSPCSMSLGCSSFLCCKDSLETKWGNPLISYRIYSFRKCSVSTCCMHRAAREAAGAREEPRGPFQLTGQ